MELVTQMSQMFPGSGSRVKDDWNDDVELETGEPFALICDGCFAELFKADLHQVNKNPEEHEVIGFGLILGENVKHGVVSDLTMFIEKVGGENEVAFEVAEVGVDEVGVGEFDGVEIDPAGKLGLEEEEKFAEVAWVGEQPLGTVVLKETHQILLRHCFLFRHRMPRGKKASKDQKQEKPD
jgi:hypothetical protein